MQCRSSTLTRGTFLGFPTLLAANELASLRSFSRFLTTTRTQVVETLGCALEECGVRLSDLFALSDKEHKGLLIQSPARPSLEINFSWRCKSTCKTWTCPRVPRSVIAHTQSLFANMKKSKLELPSKTGVFVGQMLNQPLVQAVWSHHRSGRTWVRTSWEQCGPNTHQHKSVL